MQEKLNTYNKKELYMNNAKRIKYWLIPTSEGEQIQRLIINEKIWAYGVNTPGRHAVKPNDWACFYLSEKKGVVAHAQVKSSPMKMKHPKVKNPDLYPWIFDLNEITIYLDNPIKLTKSLREKLDYFQKENPIDTKNAVKNWGVFVMNNKEISKHDFMMITRQQL